MINIQKNISLKDFTTFNIGGEAKYFCSVKSLVELKEAVTFSKEKNLPIFVLGGGSNILVADEGYHGLVIKNEILGKKIEEGRLVVCSGEFLDDIVRYSIEANLFGLENLSGIPGTIGGATVQNAGAYGLEIKDYLYSVVGVDASSGEPFIYYNNDCHFSYRTSIFKDNKNLIITEIQFKLNKEFIPQLEYAGLKKFLTSNEFPSPKEVRETVLKIREEKLPDWRKLANAGSFFKNPTISQDKFTELKNNFSQIPGFPESGDKMKIPLAWILDNICGLKNYREGNVGLYKKQPLILVNYGKATEKEISAFAEKIKSIVKEKTGIEIEEEVEKEN
jgi:UDP-N-acetylmuramate dehydrogenase